MKRPAFWISILLALALLGGGWRLYRDTLDRGDGIKTGMTSEEVERILRPTVWKKEEMLHERFRTVFALTRKGRYVITFGSEGVALEVEFTPTSLWERLHCRLTGNYEFFE